MKRILFCLGVLGCGLALEAQAAQHHKAFSGWVTIPKSGSVKVKFPKGAFKTDPYCFLQGRARIKGKPTRKYVEIQGSPGDDIAYSCTLERKDDPR